MKSEKPHTEMESNLNLIFFENYICFRVEKEVLKTFSYRNTPFAGVRDLKLVYPSFAPFRSCKGMDVDLFK